ncbi:hypothetical protein ACE1SV_49280 [Streptomyces sp. E-15]
MWWLAKVEDRNHNHVSLERGAEDDGPLEVTHSGGYRLTITTDPDYDESGRVVETHGTDGILNSRITYGGRGDDGTTSATYTDSLGHATTYRANHHGQIVSITDPLGHTTHHQWDPRDHPLSRTDPLGAHHPVGVERRGRPHRGGRRRRCHHPLLL